MANVTANTEIGRDDDIVKFYINGSLTRYTKYSVTMGIMAQPSTFSVTLGSGDVAGEALKKFTPNSKAELYVGPTRAQYGIIEDVSASSGSGATEITLSGRDWIAPLVKTYVKAEKSFGVATFR